MSLTIQTTPSDCLQSAKDCIKVCMTSDAVVYQTGDLFWYFLPLSNFIPTHTADMADSILEVDGITFTFVNGPSNPDRNEISTIGDIINNIFNLLQTNWYINKTYNMSQIFASGLLFRHKICGVTSEIKIYNGTDVVDASIFGMPQTFEFYENYRVLSCLLCDGNQITELVAYPQIQLTEDKCDVVSDPLLCLEVSNFVQDCLRTPLPNLNMPLGSPIPTGAGTMVTNISLIFTEAYGTDGLNIYRQQEEYIIGDVIAANFDRDDENRLTEYCPNILEPQQFLNIHDHELMQFCKNQAVWLYLYTGIRTNYLLNITLQVFDTNGTLVGTYPYALAVDDPMIELQASLYFFSDQLLSFLGTTREEVGKTTIQVEYIHPDTNEAFQTEEVCFNYDLEDCCDCDLQFVFLSSLETYTTIICKCPTEEKLNILQQTIELCEPCSPSTQDRGLTTIDSRAYIEIDTYILNPKNWSKKVIRDFYASKEVYLLHQGKYYAITPNGLL